MKVGDQVRIIGGPYKHVINVVGTIVHCDEESHRGPWAAWIEFDPSVVFEGADPETQHANRAWFFKDEVEPV